MSITDAIAQLQRLKDKHGDMPILISDGKREHAITDFGAIWKTKENDANQMEGYAKICFHASAKKIVAYARDGNANRNSPYTKKFASLIKAIAEAKKDGSEVMVIAEPWVIGNTYEEAIESLSRLAGTDIGLIILHRQRLAMNNQN
jgi:hypothetical protein